MLAAFHDRLTWLHSKARGWANLSMLPAIWPWAAQHTPPDEHNSVYDAKYYEFVDQTAAWSANAMADSIKRDLAPRSVLDLGCGTGALIEALREREIEVAGLEYSQAALEVCHKKHLTVSRFDVAYDHLPSHLAGRDLVVSFEVAEHLPAKRANHFIRLLTTASNTVVLGAATPGQGGTNHLNEQPHEYWIQKMRKQHFQFNEELSLQWRDEWRQTTANWYWSNAMVFQRVAG